MKLTRLFALTTALLIALVGLMLSRIVYTEWREFRSSREGLEAIQVAYKAMVVAEKVSAERGPANGVLGDGDTPDPAKRERLAKARETSDAAIRELKMAIAANAALRDGEAARALLKAERLLAVARGEVDEVGAMKKRARAPERLMGAVHAMFDVIPVVMQAVTLLSKDAENIYPQLSDSIVGARLAAELREYAGRLGSQFTAALNEKKPLGESEQRAIQELRGRIAQLSTLIELSANKQNTDARVLAAIAEMRQKYFDHALGFIAGVERASREGRPYGMDTAQFAARYVPDMGSIVRLRDVLVSNAIEGATARNAEARRNLIWIVVLGAATLLVVALIFLEIRWRVVKPLLAGTRALSDIARGNLETPVPATTQRDEIADMLHAIGSLRESSLEKRRLEAELRASRDQIAEQAALTSDRAKFVDDLFESVPIALAMRDTGGVFRYVNRTWENLVGHKREDVLGRTLFDLFPEAQAESRLALDREALERGPGSVLEGIDRMLGAKRLTQTRTVMADSQGRLLGVITASLDTTDRFATEQALATQERRLDLVVRAAKAGIVDWDGLNRTAFYSPRLRELLGHAQDADTSAWPDYFDLVHPEDAKRVQAAFREHITGKGPAGAQEFHAPIEYRLRKADGSHVWVQGMGVSVRDAKGYATRFIASITDVSQRRAQEQALHFEQERLALLVRATRAGFMDWDAVTGEMTFSERFKEMLGYPRDADTSAWPSLFDMMHPEDRDAQREAFRGMLRRGAATGEREHGPLEYRIRCADGHYLWLRGEGISHLDAEGRTKRFLTSYIDITDLRKMNAALQESVRLREEVERIARHDLKTPLNSIVAAARLLREERAPTESEAELLDVVERAGYRVLSMVNLSFDIFRMERGEYRFQPQAVDLSRLVERIAVDLRIHAVSKGVGLRLPAGGAPVHAWADELLCYSILANLLKNAIEASPDSTAVTVTLAEAGANVVLSVHNEGEVPEPVRAHFFEKYSTSGKSGGLGLGTYSARLLARVQEGDISMRTSAREGTTLEIRLLALPYGLQPVPEADERGESPAAPAVVLPPLKVLVADDDEYNLLVMRRYLPSPPLTVRTEANGRAALDALEAFPADVIFMDLEMPVMDGYEAVARIRERERASGGKPAGIVAFSSHDDGESKRRALGQGCNLYLRKPATREAVHRVLLELSGRALPAGQPGVAHVSEVPAGPADVVLVDPDMRDTVPEFLRTRREAVVQMGDALRSGDQAQLRRIAHKLAGSFALYGFRWASDHCRAIETGKGEGAGLPSQLEALGHHLSHVEIRYSDDEPVTDRQPKGSRE